MRFIPTQVHGTLDYISGCLQVAAPRLLGDGVTPMERRLPAALGAGILGYSALTAYELGVIRANPMSVHLGLDALGAVTLIAAPWFLGFSSKAKVAYTAIGLFEIVVVLTSQTSPSLSAPKAGVWQVAR